MNRIGDDLLLQELERQEDQIQTAADAIDVKAGLILAAGAFLTVQPAVLLAVATIPKVLFIVQLGSFVVLSAAVWLAHRTLKICEYDPPGFQESWRDDIAAQLPNATEGEIRLSILWAVIDQTKNRLSKNRGLNESKVKLLNRARLLIAVSFFVNLAIVSVVLVTRFF